MIRLFISLLWIVPFTSVAKETVIEVSPGKPAETFLIGSTTETSEDSISFKITIAPRTTKPTWPFHCSIKTDTGKVGWKIESPCYDEAKKKATTEVVMIDIPRAEVRSGIFEFRFTIPTTGTEEVWRIKLSDYAEGAKPE